MKDIAYYNGKIRPHRRGSGADHRPRFLLRRRRLRRRYGPQQGKIFALDDHLDRFYNSLSLLRIEPPMERSELSRNAERSG